MREWIRDPQGLKPGSLMPVVSLNETQIRQLVSYLEARK
jgi:cytochrome c1